VLTDGRGERRRAETGWWRKNSGQHLGSARWSFPDAFPATGRGSRGMARRRISRDGVGLLWKKVGGSARQRTAAIGEGDSAWPSAAVLCERDTTAGAGRRRALGHARPRALYSRQRWMEGKGVRHGRPSMARDAGGLNDNQGEALIGGETDGSYE
jgi:hypothetical protein